MHLEPDTTRWAAWLTWIERARCWEDAPVALPGGWAAAPAGSWAALTPSYTSSSEHHRQTLCPEMTPRTGWTCSSHTAPVKQHKDLKPHSDAFVKPFDYHFQPKHCFFLLAEMDASASDCWDFFFPISVVKYRAGMRNYFALRATLGFRS